MSDIYSIPVTCSNCSYSGTLTLPKGTQFNEIPFGKFGTNKECPTCGCYTLVKSDSGPKWSKPDNVWLREGDNSMLCILQKTDEQLTLNRG